MCRRRVAIRVDAVTVARRSCSRMFGTTWKPWRRYWSVKQTVTAF